MKRLIVNADDLGADKPRNDGIIEAITAGSVTSCSILPNGPSLADALDKIRALNLKNISWGIHINLSEGKPLSKGLRRLTNPDDRFLGKASAQRLLVHRGDLELEEEIREELAAQIRLLQNAGVPIDHMDGHQHVHIFPAVVRLAAEAAKANGIPWIRTPEEPSDGFSGYSPLSLLANEALFFNGHAEAARPLFTAMGIFTADHFRGLYFKGHLPASQWMEFLESMPQGLTELMVHPGRSAGHASGPFSSFSTADREKELEALTDGRFRAALLKTGVTITPFPERLV
jgi:chitin disaccharide deacetylase